MKNTQPTTFRLVVTTQILENYGTCWKPKGGSEYQANLGSADDVIDLGKEGLNQKVVELTTKIERYDDRFEEYVTGWELVPSNVKTPDEKLRDLHANTPLPYRT